MLKAALQMPLSRGGTLGRGFIIQAFLS